MCKWRCARVERTQVEVVQVLALLYYIMSYFPGGTQGMQFALSMAGRAILSCFGRSAPAAG